MTLYKCICGKIKFLTVHQNMLRQFDKFDMAAYLTLYSLGSNFEPTVAKYIVGNLKNLNKIYEKP